jgi:hypothetical protein
MKKQIILIAALIITCFGYTAHAQVSVSVNIGSQPLWGPTGYDHASYYYLPDIDAYYDVNAQQYVYMDGGQWVTRPNLPPQYASYDLYGGYKVVVNQPRPWLHAATYRTKYARYKGHHGQGSIRDSHLDKYRANPNHPEHNQYHGGGNNNQGHGNNNHQPAQVNHGNNQGHPQGGQPNQNHPQGGGQPNQGHPQGGQPNGGHQGGQPNGGHPQGGQPAQGHPEQGHGEQGHGDEHGR